MTKETEDPGAEADNVVLRHLRELRAEMNARFDGVDARLDASDLRTMKLELRVDDLRDIARKALSGVISISARVGSLQDSVDLLTRIGNLEKQVAELQAAARQAPP